MKTAIFTEQACARCQYSVTEYQQGMQQMFCRRLPPKAEVVMTQTPHGAAPANVLAVFPPVQPEMWCGEFKRRIIHEHSSRSLSA